MPYCRNLFFNDFDQLRADSCVLKITVNSLRTFGMIGLFLAGLLFVRSLGAANELSPVEQLGKQLFFDCSDIGHRARLFHCFNQHEHMVIGGRIDH